MFYLIDGKYCTMVRLKAVHISTEEGFTIYNQSFGATEQDQDMVGSLIMALTSFGKEAMGESLSSLAFGREEEGTGGADMILESGDRIISIAIVVLDKEHKEREEYTIRNDLRKFTKEVERIYSEDLNDPIFQKSAFSGVGTLIFSIFFRDKMSRIYNQDFASLSEYTRFPTTLLFEITPRGPKLYSFYREYPGFREIMTGIPIEDFDQLIYNMQDTNSMVSFKDCLETFGIEKGNQVLNVFKFLTKRGMFEAYNFERIDA